MEDVARLAVIEQTVGDVGIFNKVLHDLLQQIDHILENPHDLEHRTLKTIQLKIALEHKVFCEYLKYLGFELTKEVYTFPKEKSLLKLQLAKTAIERKISICYGTKQKLLVTKPLRQFLLENKPKLKPVYIGLFNDVLKYEDEELQAQAREQIPHIELQLKAIERVRDHQKQLKIGKIKGDDLSYEIALLMELMGWFKYQFFTWVDKPECEKCGSPTIHSKNDTVKADSETCRLEVYKCTKSNSKDHGAQFYRYNEPATLLRSRRGRCGEWANCFALFCRAMGYDTRYVYDITDHVWCEVYDYANGKWLHVDPCECTIDAPLTYSCGWGKKLTYVIAVSRDDLQDVTWRYTTKHNEVFERRTLCSERDLISTLISLRSTRQMHVSEHRRRYLAKRCIKELVQLMVEREPGENEMGGRISGAVQWRKARKEISTEGYTFIYDEAGSYAVEYCCAEDRYELLKDDQHDRYVKGFDNGCYTLEGIFRKVETDWGQVYLAREESEEEGNVSWRLCAKEGLRFHQLTIAMSWACFGEGRITFSLQIDGEKPNVLPLSSGNSATWKIDQQFKQAVLRAHLSGGSGHVAWQQAQLFRQESNVSKAAMRLETNVINVNSGSKI